MVTTPMFQLPPTRSLHNTWGLWDLQFKIAFGWEHSQIMSGCIVFCGVCLPLFNICSSIGEHLVCFHTIVIVNNAKMYMGIQVSLQYTDLNFFVYIVRNWIAESYSSSIFNYFEDLLCQFSY